MRRRIEIIAIERERIVQFSGKLVCPECQKAQTANFRRIVAAGIELLKACFFKLKQLL
ncbi:MAG TPA: hypothetical protein VK892_18600 [Pyrinomonadaceae bacterium]|nr:hypothetical protein [Pyrinomonadaceae bacterium]